MGGFVVFESGVPFELPSEEGAKIFCKQQIQTYQAQEQSGGKRMVGSGDTPVPLHGERPFPPASVTYKPYPPSGEPPIVGSGRRGFSSITPVGDSAEGGEGAEVGNVAALMARRRAGKSLETEGAVVIEKAKETMMEMPFPKQEMKEIMSRFHHGKDVVTTRVDDERGKYKKKQKVHVPGDGIVCVKEIIHIRGIGKHPFKEELTESQKKQLGKKKSDVVTLHADKVNKGQDGATVIIKATHPPPQGKEKILGVPILIENKRGSVRQGKDKDGTRWKTVMRDHYGEFTGVPGVDGDYLDVFIGPEARKIKATGGKEGAFDKVWVIHAKNKDSGRYDEDKVMFGYATKHDAVRAFRQHYDQSDKFIGPVNEYSLLEFKEKIEGLKGHRKGERLGRGRFHKK